MIATAVSFRTRAADRASTARVFHALSNETRLAVLEMLRGGELCVCDLQNAVGAAQSRLSFHLKVLKDAGLVTDRKEARWSYYALSAERLAEAGATLGALIAPALARAGQPAMHVLARGPRKPGARAARNRTLGRPGGGCCTTPTSGARCMSSRSG